MLKLKTAIFIDDEVNNIRIMKREFLRYEGWLLHTCESAEQAIDLIKNESLDPQLVITDQNMPAKKGYDFLVELKVSHPNSFGVLTTANEDMVNKIAKLGDFNSCVDEVLFKPWKTKFLDSILGRFN